jgi:acyl-CoA synthetase (AMP-forming)/AMP-acid ligase II
MKNQLDIIFSKRRIKSSAIFLYCPDSNYELSYIDLFKKSLDIAYELRIHGLKKGDKILVFFDNTANSVIVAFSLMIIGAVLVPVDPDIKNDPLQYIIKNSKCKYAILFKENHDIDLQNSLIVIDYKHIIKNHHESKQINEFCVFPNDIIVILYTSGSTGKPKGIVFTFGSVIKNFKEYGKTMNFSSRTRFLQVMPMYHADGWNFTLLMPYLFNCTVILTKKFDLNVCRDIFRISNHYNCNVLVSIPSILDSMILFSERYDKISLPIYNFIITSSEKLFRKTKDLFEQLFQCHVYDLYGLTETQVISYYNENFKWIPGSTGKLQKRVQAKFSEDGELLIKSPYLFKEYCNNKSLTERVKKEGWFHTGDLGYLSDNGYLFLVGRINDIINKGGEKIAPNSIDIVIKELNFIDDCYSMGVDDEIYGQDILTLVKIADICEVNDPINSIINHCSLKLNKNSIPKYILLVDSFPLNNVGKKDIFKIKEIVNAHKLK